MVNKTAVLVQAHSEVDHILTLAKENPCVNFYIHCDIKNEKLNKELQALNVNNLHVINDPIEVHWGGVSQVQATLKLLKFAFSNEENNYFHLISGECFPVKSFQEIEKEWECLGDVQFVEVKDRPETYWRLNLNVPYSNTPFIRTFPGKICNRIYMLLGKLIKTTSLEKEMYCYGSQWFSVTRKYAEIFLKEEALGFFEQFKYTSCVDEHAFQIILKKYGISVGVNKRYIQFQNNKSSPKYLTYEEMKSINFDEYWFARKIKSSLAQRLLNE